MLRAGANLGFAGAANLGLRRALDDGADRVVVVNSDAFVEPDCIEQLERALDLDPHAGLAAPALIADADGKTIESLGIRFSQTTGRMRQRSF